MEKVLEINGTIQLWASCVLAIVIFACFSTIAFVAAKIVCDGLESIFNPRIRNIREDITDIVSGSFVFCVFTGSLYFPTGVYHLVNPLVYLLLVIVIGYFSATTVRILFGGFTLKEGLSMIASDIWGILKFPFKKIKQLCLKKT